MATAEFAYMNVASFRLATLMPGEDVDALESAAPGYLDQRLLNRSSYMNARLVKRYAAPFPAGDVPAVVLDWLNALVTYDAYMKRGQNPSATQDAQVKENYDEAKAEIKEAADSKDGLFDLPLRASEAGTDAVVVGGPLGYSETSPYVWADIQECTGRQEDQNGRPF